jgi:transposase
MSALLKTLILTAAIGLGANAASAAVVVGKVQHVYPRHHSIMLKSHVYDMSGQTFRRAEPRRGEPVRVTYHLTHHVRWATSLHAA